MPACACLEDIGPWYSTPCFSDLQSYFIMLMMRACANRRALRNVYIYIYIYIFIYMYIYMYIIHTHTHTHMQSPAELEQSWRTGSTWSRTSDSQTGYRVRQSGDTGPENVQLDSSQVISYARMRGSRDIRPWYLFKPLIFPRSVSLFRHADAACMCGLSCSVRQW